MAQHLTAWHAAVAIILALGVAITLVLLAANELTHSGHISSDETTVIATVAGAVVGAVATFLGMADRAPDEVGESQLITRWPLESHLKAPYDQAEDEEPPDPDATAEYPVQP
jgi:hypothetical protein